MTNEEGRVQRAPESPAGSSIAYLSNEDISRLTSYKWRYSLEAHGFSSDQAARLLFMKWLFRRGGLRP
jgi:hypothetical protein